MNRHTPSLVNLSQKKGCAFLLYHSRIRPLIRVGGVTVGSGGGGRFFGTPRVIGRDPFRCGTSGRQADPCRRQITRRPQTSARSTCSLPAITRFSWLS